MNRKLWIIWVGLFLLRALPVISGPFVQLENVASGLVGVADLANAGDGSNRLFPVVRTGVVRVIRDDELIAAPFLDIRNRVVVVGEGGLLGLAFHPQFRNNGRFFVAYTASENGGNRTLRLIVAEYRVSAENPDRASPDETRILIIEQPTDIHQGGDLAFGPDGFLYISSGDGGPGSDPGNRGQDLNTLLGKILRIDVDDGEAPYRIPDDNPFVGREGARGEIWAYGFRNPFRMGFDRETGRLFVGDVGHARFEEIDLVVKGANYGWPRLEGNHCFPEEVLECDTQGLIPPIHEYGRGDGGAVIGGLVYRGRQPTPLWGAYIFGDFLSGRIFALQEIGRGQWRRVQLERITRPVAFAEDERGELYVADIRNGSIFRFRFRWLEILAQIGDGQTPAGRFQTTALLVNPHDVDVAASLVFLKSNGEQAETSIGGPAATVHVVVVEARSSRVVLTPGTSNPFFTGWAGILSDRPLRSAALFKLSADAALPAAATGPVFQAGVTGAPVGVEFLGPVLQSADGRTNGALAVVNPSVEEPMEFNVAFHGADGREFGSRSYRLGPLQHLALFLSEVAQLPPDFQGTVRLSSDRDMAPILIQTLDGIHSAQLPLERVR